MFEGGGHAFGGVFHFFDFFPIFLLKIACFWPFFRIFGVFPFLGFFPRFSFAVASFWRFFPFMEIYSENVWSSKIWWTPCFQEVFAEPSPHVNLAPGAVY